LPGERTGEMCAGPGERRVVGEQRRNCVNAKQEDEVEEELSRHRRLGVARGAAGRRRRRPRRPGDLERRVRGPGGFRRAYLLGEGAVRRDCGRLPRTPPPYANGRAGGAPCSVRQQPYADRLADAKALPSPQRRRSQVASVGAVRRSSSRRSRLPGRQQSGR
jgi:hypothetical protein